MVSIEKEMCVIRDILEEDGDIRDETTPKYHSLNVECHIISLNSL